MPNLLAPQGLEFTPVSPRLITARRITRGCTALVLLALACLPLVLRSAGVWPAFASWLAWLLAIGTLVASVWAMALIPRQVRAIGYAERDDDLLIRRGIFFQRLMVVPYGRMQYVDVTVGPLERALGLTSLRLHTASASTNAALSGISAAEAARLREQLTARGEAKLAGL
jgi:membrane protein YdbS with pleckstrin-like domain